MASVASRVALIFGVGALGGAELGKVPISLPILSEAFGLSLVHGGLLLGMFQVALMAAGIVAGMLADRFGQRRVMIWGLLVAAVGSAIGALASNGPVLLASRAIESAGFMAMVLPGPALMARFVAARRLRAVMGLWACYMPTGMGLVLMLAPLVLASLGWRALWWMLALIPLVLAGLVALVIDPDPKRPAVAGAGQPAPRSWPLVAATLASPGAWLLAAGFGAYAGQWMTVMGFLPTLYGAEGIAAASAGALTAVGALVNVSGNFAAGLLVQRGVPAWRLLLLASLTMLICSWVLFGSGWPFPVRYLGLLVFSAVGGLIPGTLFGLTHHFAPGPGAVSTTTGLMQQGSAIGQFVVPPAAAWAVSGAGSWSVAWLVTGVMALLNIGLALALRASTPAAGRRTA